MSTPLSRSLEVAQNAEQQPVQPQHHNWKSRLNFLLHDAYATYMHTAVYAMTWCQSETIKSQFYIEMAERIKLIWQKGYPCLALHCVVTEFGCLQKYGYFFWNVVTNSKPGRFSASNYSMSTIASVVNLVQPSQVYHTQDD